MRDSLSLNEFMDLTQNVAEVVEERDTRPHLTIEQVQSLLAKEYGLIVKAWTPLDSERDQNFYVQEMCGAEFVFKISNVDEDPELLDMQNKILQHLARSGLTSPELVLTKSHKEMFPFYASGIQRPHYIRLLKWIPGKVLAKIQNHSYVLLRDVGRALAKVDRALQSFTHRAMHRTTLIWEMRNTALLRPFIPFLEKTNPPERVQIAREAVHYFEEHNRLILDSSFVRRGVAHNDANDWNILVNDEENAVVALIDYGDACYTAYVCNLAICMAYCMLLNQERYLDVAKEVLHGYQSEFPLSTLEIELLPSLIKLRLATSVIISSKRMLERPNDPYVIVSQKPAWALLEFLSRMPLNFLAEVFKSWTNQ